MAYSRMTTKLLDAEWSPREPVFFPIRRRKAKEKANNEANEPVDQ